MSELLDKIIEAKGVLGDRQAEIIAEGYPLEEWNPEKGSAKSIFNANDNTPSMMWMKKDYYFKDFSTGKVFGILDYYMYKFHEPYMKSVKRLLDETGVKYSSSLFNFVSTTEQKDYFKNFRYPHAENDISGVALEYMSKRGISEDTCRYVGLGCDHNGNVAYQFHDLTGKVVTVKYRPSHAVKHGEPKYFYQKNADTCPILYNIDRIDPTKPVLITEGMCFPGDAEVMTADGWVRLDKYNDTEVMQVNSDGSCEFVMPIAKIAHEYNGEFVVTDRGGNYYSATTSDHNIVVNTCGTLVKRKVGDMPNSIEGTIPTTAMYCGGDGIDLSDDEIRLFVAFSADGCYNNASYYLKSNKKRIRFIFAKRRKFDRLKEILERIGIEYTETKHEYDRYTTGIKYYIGFEDKKKYLNKVFPWQWIKDMTKHQREVFLDELCFWDGYKFNNRNMGEYYSEIKSNVDFVQAMCHTSGFMATIKHRKDREKNCSVSMLYSKNHVSWQNMWSSGSAKRIKYSGMVYCLTVPSGMLIVRQNEKIAVTGNCDTMACIEAGFKNVVSIPSGANDDNWINFNYEFLDQFKEIILWFDNDEAGESGEKKAIPRLGEYRIKIVKPTEDDEQAVYDFYKSVSPKSEIRKTDANNILVSCGSARVLALINSAEEIPMESVIDLMTCESFDIEKTEFIPSGISSLDRQIYGYIDGSLNIWTAKSGTGKSTMISQSVVLEAIDRGETVFWFNAESTTSQMLNWIVSQAAGRQHMVEYSGVNGFKYYKPTIQAEQAIKQYYSKKIYVYDNLLLSNPNMVMDKMKYLHKKRGTKVFVLDNWLCLNFRGISDTEVTGIQVDFMNELIHFAKQSGLEVHLVCHPRKTQQDMPLTEYDILGTSNIVNLADRIYGLEKPWDNDLRNLGYDRQFTVFKDRILGVKGERIGLRYDRVTRRLYGDGDDKYKSYSWDKGLIRYNTPIFGKNGLLVGDRVLDYEQAAANNTPY